jgi:ATP-dependent DNA helicase DinG
MIEAPTGSGKSLAALIPALAHASEGKRVVIATYTNILAEQYWRKDLPVALQLFDWPDEEPRTAFLVGRSRYACRQRMREHGSVPVVERFANNATLGLDSEFYATARGPRERSAWDDISVPAACQGRQCADYRHCFFFEARSAARGAHIVITNHSVFLSDLLVRNATKGEVDLLGNYDYAILDEAHDFPAAAASAMNFDLNTKTIELIAGVVESAMSAPEMNTGELGPYASKVRRVLEEAQQRASGAFLRFARVARPGIVKLAPESLLMDANVGRHFVGELEPHVHEVVDEVQRCFGAVRDALAELRGVQPEEGEDEAVTNLINYLEDFIGSCLLLAAPDEVSLTAVTWNQSRAEPNALSRRVVDIGPRLARLMEAGPPCTMMSATMTVDGSFEFLASETGLKPKNEELLPPVFHTQSCAALFVPPPDRIPDPTATRDPDAAESYYAAVAEVVGEVLTAVGGRSLVLFHSRREMDEVHRRVSEVIDLPTLIQRTSGARSVGDRFRKDVPSSLFAVRSFWTGFDAPGETLSCVIIVRIPFEVPVEPEQLVRHAWYRSRGLDPFRQYTLPLAKMMVRQGAGRLLRTHTDRGIICVLDPRVQSRGYGEEVLANLPPMRRFANIEEAAAHVGIGCATDFLRGAQRPAPET